MKSLRRMGRRVAARIAVKSVRAPPKLGPSVRTDKHAAAAGFIVLGNRDGIGAR